MEEKRTIATSNQPPTSLINTSPSEEEHSLEIPEQWQLTRMRHYKKRKSDPVHCSLTPPGPNDDIHSTQTPSVSKNIVPHSKNIDKRPRSTRFFCMTNISSSLKKNMPISINNSLPSINLYIGIPEDIKIHIRMLVDIGAIINTGNLKYSLWVMS